MRMHNSITGDRLYMRRWKKKSTWLRWGIDADPKVSVASVALVMSDLTQPGILGYVRPDITESWEFPSYVRPDITESWELSVMSDLTQPRIVGYVRPDITKRWD